MNEGLQRQVHLIVGPPGSGKTFEAGKRLEQYSRALVLEANFGEFRAIPFRELDGLIDHLEKIRAFAPDVRAGRFSQVPFRVSYSPLQAEIPVVFDLPMELGNCAFFLEEADRFDDPRFFYEFDEVLTRGRHHLVHIVALYLHPFKCPKDLRRQAATITCFQQTDPDDIAYLSEIIGPDAEKIPTLPKFHKLVWSPNSGAKIVPPTV